MKRDPLALAALLAAIVVTASAEYSLARACGYGPWVAGALPGALDVYALRALRAHRDVLAVVGAMIAVNALAHLVSAGLLGVSVPLVVAVSAIAPLVLWRVHALRDAEGAAVVEPAGVPGEAGPVSAPLPAAEPNPYRDLAEVRIQREYGVPEAYPELAAAPPRPIPQAVPAGAVMLPIVPTDGAGVPEDGYDEDPLTERARKHFATEDPSVRRIREVYRVGQPRAQRIRDELLGVR